MPGQNELEQVVQQLESMVQSAASDSAMSSADLRQVLSFIAKVVGVVDQAFADVYTVLIELKNLETSDLEPNRMRDLRMNLDLVLSRSQYRDAEEICSRLYHLRDRFDTQIRPLIAHLSDANTWESVFHILQDREGAIIGLIQAMVYHLGQDLENLDRDSLPEFKTKSGEMAESIRLSLSELRSLSNQIIGLSGQPGLMELTSDRSALAAQARIFIESRPITVTHDTYSAGQAGAMGPGAHAQDMTFQQVWNQQSGNIDLPALATELSALRDAMRKEATSAEHDMSVGHVAMAEKAAKEGNGPSALEHLKNAGKWALDVATKIGVGVATVAVKSALGL